MNYELLNIERIVDCVYRENLKVLIYGGDKSPYLIEMFKKFGIEVTGYIDRDYEKLEVVNHIKVYDKGVIKEGGFFIFVDLKETYKEVIDFLEKSGYVEFITYWYPRRRVVLEGNIDYCDLYGNEYRGAGYKFNLELRNGGKVYIGRNCNIPSGSSISADGDSEIRICENFEVSEKLSIKCSDKSKIFLGSNFFSGTPLYIECCKQSKIEIGSNFGSSISMMEGSIRCLYFSTIKIGRDMSVGQGYDICAEQYSVIEIGNDAMISRGVIIRSGNGHNIWDIRSEKNLSKIGRKVKVGEHVWIGHSAILFNGCNVGDGSIIGLNTFVNGEFPTNCSVAGNPAKIINDSIAWRREFFVLYDKYDDFQNFDYR